MGKKQIKRALSAIASISLATVGLTACGEVEAKAYASVEEFESQLANVGFDCPEPVKDSILNQVMNGRGIFSRYCSDSLSYGWASNSQNLSELNDFYLWSGDILLSGPNWTVSVDSSQLATLESLQGKLGGEIIR